MIPLALVVIDQGRFLPLPIILLPCNASENPSSHRQKAHHFHPHILRKTHFSADRGDPFQRIVALRRGVAECVEDACRTPPSEDINDG